MKRALITLCGLAGVAIIITRPFGDTQHRGDGWCLSYDREDVVFVTQNPAANTPVPFFLVPSDVQTSSILDAPEATGWTVRFTKWRSGPFADQATEGCGETVLDNGLVKFPPKTYPLDSPASECPGLSFKDYFLPDASDPLRTLVRIDCDTNVRVPNCRMVDRMPNGWQASISLPRPHLDRWRDASADARAYFDAYLTDCGPEAAR